MLSRFAALLVTALVVGLAACSSETAQTPLDTGGFKLPDAGGGADGVASDADVAVGNGGSDVASKDTADGLKDVVDVGPDVVEIEDGVANAPDDSAPEIEPIDGCPGGCAEAWVDVCDDIYCPDESCYPGSGPYAACPCKQNGDCISGACIDTPKGKRCAETCVSECADKEYDCKTVQVGGDNLQICIAKFTTNGAPCDATIQCKAAGTDGVCVSYGGAGSFCGVKCWTNDDCPGGYLCADVKDESGASLKACAKAGGATPDCSVYASENGMKTTCSTSNDIGTCKAARGCTATGLEPCAAPMAATETCDGADNDCNGKTDESGPGVCNDGNACTYDNCIAAECQHPPVTGGCDDGDPCTESDACEGSVCKGKTKDCDDKNPCTDDACNDGACAWTPNTAPCDDGNACTTGEFCEASACKPGAWSCACKVDGDCDDKNTCTVDACDAGACKQVPVDIGTPCEDGNACTAGDACKAGACVPGALIDCDDGNLCTTDGCKAESGCTHGNNSVPCTDSNVCTLDDVCKDGACAPGTPLDCDDGNACTDDGCDKAAGCKHANNTVSCNDLDACTKGDQCAGGKCMGSETVVCDDGNVCTDDSCDKLAGCKHANNTASCDDKSACTTADTCKDGACVGGAAPDCEDKNPCTTDGCDKALGCQHANNTDTCEDGDACTTKSQCSNGKCVGSAPPDCNDANVCTDDACDKATGCTHTNNAAGCDDGDGCTIGDACKDGACKAGPAPSCSNGVQDGAETDQDCGGVAVCGGTACEACPDLSKCKAGADCASKVCNAGQCVGPTCTDTTQNSDESDIDCGGWCGGTCMNNQKCKINSDCASGYCTTGLCQDAARVLLASGGAVFGATYDHKGAWTKAPLAGTSVSGAGLARKDAGNAVGLIRFTKMGDPSDNVIQYTVWSNNQWSVVQNIGGSILTRGRPAVAYGDGAYHLVYHGIDYLHYHTTWDGVSGWSSAVSLSTAPSGSPVAPDLAVRPNGNAPTALYVVGPGNTLGAAQLGSGESWSAMGTLAPSPSYGFSPSISALKKGGDLLAVWAAQSNGQVSFAVATDGTFGSATAITNAYTATTPLASSLKEAGLVGWRGTNGKVYYVLLSQPQSIVEIPNTTGTTTPAFGPGLGTHQLEAVWVDAAGKLQHASRLLNGTWSAYAEVGAGVAFVEMR